MWQGVGYESPVSHRLRRSPCRPVEQGRRVFGSIRATSVYLQGPAIIQVPRHRAAYNAHTANTFVSAGSHAKLVADYRLVMPVVLLNKGVCFCQCYRGQFKHRGVSCSGRAKAARR